MATVRSAKGAGTRNRILDAARDALAEEGMEGFSRRTKRTRGTTSSRRSFRADQPRSGAENA